MKLEEIRKDYERYSTQVSNINRQLIFAGIAVIWLFRSTTEGETNIPKDLYTPLLLFVFSFVTDIFQYISQSVIWYIYYWKQKCKNRQHTNVEENIVKEPEWLNIIPWVLWGLKVIFSIRAYVSLASFLHIV